MNWNTGGRRISFRTCCEQDSVSGREESLLDGFANHPDIGRGAPGFSIDFGEDPDLDVAPPDGFPAGGGLRLPVLGKGGLGSAGRKLVGGIAHVEFRFSEAAVPAAVLPGKVTEAGDAVDGAKEEVSR